MNQQSTANDFSKRNEYGNFEANLQFLDQAAVLAPTIEILEIGSGKGKLLSRYYQSGYHITGIDIKESQVHESKSLHGSMPVTVMMGDVLGFRNASFDVVMSFDVFEHIFYSDRHLQEVSRVLKPQGYYLLQTPNKWTNTIFETIRWKSFTAWRADHCALHSYWEIKRRFEKHGFDLEFYSIPVVNEFFTRKLKAYLGGWGLLLLRVIDPDRLPLFLKTNFYIKARKCL
jgi:cyclopropane fatty-acyl-phospholipid synthase-like methyltransferase